MNSVILSATARIFFTAMLLVSIWILFRGHNEPGGGFVGGLMGAAAFSILAFASGVPTARRALILHPIVLAGVGLALAALSGLPGLFYNDSYLLHHWGYVPLGFTEIKVGTTMIFDLGVYFVVVGGILSFIFRLYEEQPV
ncbi:MAG: Na(+)/H(+) antiporter subunit B [Salinarimonadaceae bacterium]|nr:MAG: Na(+)/H(+) antiporter subunit B [Salinarimonadaceae bacterium]